MGEEQAFQQSKSLLNSSNLLIHYDPEKPMIIACDVSPYGLGAVYPTSCPINMKAKCWEKLLPNWKRGVSYKICFKKFHQYIYGRNVAIQMHHEPIRGLPAEHKNIPSMAAAIILSVYDYKLLSFR